jgi:hypothetical protein
MSRLCEKLVAGAGVSSGTQRKFAVGRTYRATADEGIADSEDLVCAIVNCEMCRTVRVQSSLVVTRCNK